MATARGKSSKWCSLPGCLRGVASEDVGPGVVEGGVEAGNTHNSVSGDYFSVDSLIRD